MKKIFTAILVLSMTNLALARVDLNNYSNVDGKLGKGQNAYEDGLFDCKIEIDSQENVLIIEHAGAYVGRTVILGDQIVSQSSISNGILLKTKKTNPIKSGLCGDFISARSLQQRLEITAKSVSITTSYWCGLKYNSDLMTCNF